MASIEIFGDDDYILIDDNFKNLIVVDSFRAVFPLPSGPGANLNRGAYYDVRYTSAEPLSPLLAVSSSFPTVLTYFQRSGNDYYWRVGCGPAGRNQSAEFYLLHLPQTVPNANGILQIFNALGELVFDSNHDYCKSETRMMTTMANDTSIALTPNRKFAHVLTIPAYQYSVAPASGGSTGQYETNIVMTYAGISFGNGTAFGTRYTQTAEYVVFPFPPGGGQTNNTSNCLIIDVTGVQIRRNA